MEWLTRLPVIGPWVARAMRTRGRRAFEHAQEVTWARLAATLTPTGSIALCPLITPGPATGAAILPKGRLDAVIHKADERIPGLARQVDLAGPDAKPVAPSSPVAPRSPAARSPAASSPAASSPAARPLGGSAVRPRRGSAPHPAAWGSGRARRRRPARPPRIRLLHG